MINNNYDDDDEITITMLRMGDELEYVSIPLFFFFLLLVFDAK